MLNKLKYATSINYNLYLNHLLVVYSFLLPISGRAKSSIFLLILVVFILRGKYFHYIKIAFSNKICQAFVLFFLVHIIWLVGMDNFAIARNVIDDMKYLLFSIIFLSFLDKDFSLRIITAFTFGMFYSEVISYLIHFEIIPHELNLFKYNIYSSPGTFDPTPFLDHSRYTVLLSLVISLFLYNILHLRLNIFFKSIMILFMVSASFNLILIGGRIGYISFFMLLVFVIILKYRKKALKPMLLLFLTIIMFFSFAYTFSNTFNKRINLSKNTLNNLYDNNTDYNSSFGLRLGFWVYSKDVIKENFILGVGTGDYLDEVKKIIPEEHSYLKSLSNSHNEFIKILLQFGIVGLIMYLNIFYQIFRINLKSQYMKNVLLIASLSILIGTMTSTFGSKIYLPLLVIIACATTTKNKFLKKSNGINGSDFIVYLILSTLALTLATLQ